MGSRNSVSLIVVFTEFLYYDKPKMHEIESGVVVGDKTSSLPSF